MLPPPFIKIPIFPIFKMKPYFRKILLVILPAGLYQNLLDFFYIEYFKIKKPFRFLPPKLYIRNGQLVLTEK